MTRWGIGRSWPLTRGARVGVGRRGLYGLLRLGPLWAIVSPSRRPRRRQRRLQAVEPPPLTEGRRVIDGDWIAVAIAVAVWVGFWFELGRPT